MVARIRSAPREARWLIALVLAVVLASALALLAGENAAIPVVQIYSGYVETLLVLGVPVCLASAAALTIVLAFQRVQSPIAEIRRMAASRVGTWNCALGTLGPIVLLPLLMGAFGTLKQVMPMVTGFEWDNTFALIGREMFFGIPPWRITHAIFGPRATQGLDFLYAAWVPLLFVMILGFSTLARPELRARFVLAFAGCWLLLGVVGAFVFASAGPCFAPLIGAPDGAEFAPLVARLHAMDKAGYPLVTLAVQNELWQSYISHSYGFGMGISAMPSMHNSMAFLYVLAAGGARAPVKVAAWLFAVTILIASVHLGWHYLADGLFAWAATAAIWRGAGIYLRWCGYAPERATVALEAARPEASDFAEPYKLAA